MRLVLQRVHDASVRVGDAEVSRIGRGLVALVGLGPDDTEADLIWCVDRIATTALWPEHVGATEEGKAWHNSVASAGLDVLCVSQFTLFATLKRKKGGLTFHNAMAPTPARVVYADFLAKVRAALPQCAVRDGEFGARMNVNLTNDGPVTLTLDSRSGNGLVPINGPTLAPTAGAAHAPPPRPTRALAASTNR
ncbi:D-Tyr tRNAtyr deacylase-like domain-containing protein [Pelagophyceae sp. CCMP2097]|nr:D-Tyr tRNAtyr deacylase-like domain-containing protein [Pelagophyceae sp. CCMP2097]